LFGKLINQLKKIERSLIMNTFRDKLFKNELDPKYAFYDCLRSCELKSASGEYLKECKISCEWEPPSKDLDN